MNSPEIPVDCFGGMEELTADTHRGERGGDLLANKARLAHPGHDDAAPAAMKRTATAALNDSSSRPASQTRHGRRLGRQNFPRQTQLFNRQQRRDRPNC